MSTTVIAYCIGISLSGALAVIAIWILLRLQAQERWKRLPAVVRGGLAHIIVCLVASVPLWIIVLVASRVRHALERLPLYWVAILSYSLATVMVLAAQTGILGHLFPVFVRLRAKEDRATRVGLLSVVLTTCAILLAMVTVVSLRDLRR